jgi:outer membrane receptor protein involved in Fe transport
MKNLLVRLAVLLAATVAVWGQNTGGLGSISGVVTDATGAVVPGANVVVENMSKGVKRELVTNSAGVFIAPALIPAEGYTVTVTKPGFASYEVKDIVLLVGEQVNLTPSMTVASAATQITVAAVSPLIEDTKTDVSTVVNTNDVMNLPINGRRVDSFALVAPGVNNDGTFGLLSFRGVAGNNSFLLDGNDNTEQFYDENAGRTRIQSQISLDAVQEFSVVSANFSAEYGRAMGGVLNTVTKSGTNAFHGTAFYFLRSTGMDARDPFATFSEPNGTLVGINPSERRMQTGGTVGGPIIKNKLFFFLSADITRRNFPMVDSQIKVGVIDPVNQVWLGCGAPATPAQCSAINQVLPRFYGLVPRTDKNDLYFGRLDYHPTDKNTISASFNFLRWFSPNGIQTGLSSTVGAAINGNGDDAVTVRNGKLAWTYVPKGSLVNAFRYGLDTDRQGDGFDQAELGTGLGYLQVNVAAVTLGPANYLPRVEPLETRNEFADDLSWVKGRHILKFGGNFVNTQDNVYYISNAFGTYTYQTPTTFAQDYSGANPGAKNWSGYSQTFGNPVADFWIREFGLYVQDQWRATDRLTVNLGLRYERSLVQQPTVVNPDYPETGKIHTGTLNFMPRIGLAYRVNDKTVVRGGFGTFYARLVGGLVDNLFTTNGIYQISDALNNTNPTQLAAGPLFPSSLGAPPTGASVSASTLQFAAPNLKTPYSEQATVAVERQFGKDMVVTVSGIWSRGVNLYGVTDVNAPYPSTTFTYKIDDANGNQTGTFTTPVYLNVRPNTKYGAIYDVTNGTNSYYDALVATFEKRFSHGFQSLLSYTWSHEIDEGQGGGSSAIFFSSLASYTYNGNYGFEKGSGTLDQRQRLSYSFVWTPPQLKSNNLIAKYVVNNWQLSSITTLGSGRPAGSPTIRTTDTAVPNMLSSSVINGLAGGNSRVPFLPVNAIYGPAAYREDLRVTKIIPLPWEHINLSVAGEAFNISNSWSPTSLTLQEYTEAKGVLTLTPGAYGVGSADGGFPDGTQARRLQVAARLVF